MQAGTSPPLSVVFTLLPQPGAHADIALSNVAQRHVADPLLVLVLVQLVLVLLALVLLCRFVMTLDKLMRWKVESGEKQEKAKNAA